jgi:uncharacterized protein (TIGR02217 family)
MSSSVFPQLPGMAWGLTRQKVWASRSQRSVSGKRQAVGYSSYPIIKYSLNFNVLRQNSTQTELETLEGFFDQMHGMVDTFLFADPLIATATTQQFGTGDGVTDKFQLVKTWGGFTFPVLAPNLITQLRKAGVNQTAPTNYTLLANGVVDFVTPPAAGNALDWTGTFYQKVAFSQDTLDLINQDGVGIWKTNKISFETVK